VTSGDQTCGACGAALRGGRFCGECGAAAGPGGTRCSGCGATPPPGARFCLSCGRALAATANRWRRVPLIVGGIALVAVLAALLRTEGTARSGQPAGPVPAAAIGAGDRTPPDLSQMTPRERFDRLYNRVMQASEGGDTATVAQFTPMALAAYGMLDAVDADARYHAAMLRLHTGDTRGAAALADTILAAVPTHLFGYVIRGTLARWERDESALTLAHRMFAANYDEEQSANRPEYRDHKTVLDRFLEEARRK